MSAKKLTGKALALADALRVWPNKPGRTPKTEAYGVLNTVHEHYARCFKLDADDTVNGWLGRYYVPMGGKRGLPAEVMSADHEKLGADFLAMLDATRACVRALHAVANNNSEAAWSWIADARFWAGILLGRNNSDQLLRGRRKGVEQAKVQRAEARRAKEAEVMPVLEAILRKFKKRYPQRKGAQAVAALMSELKEHKSEIVREAGRPTVKRLSDQIWLNLQRP